MMCMIELHGGVCHRTSTPHKSGNKMKEKKKKKIDNAIICISQLQRYTYVLGTNNMKCLSINAYRRDPFDRIHCANDGPSGATLRLGISPQECGRGIDVNDRRKV